MNEIENTDQVILYRFDSDIISNTIQLYKFRVIKETEKGYWIHNYVEPGHLNIGRLNGKKWFNKNAWNTWAKKTEVEALQNYIWRKKFQIKKVTSRLDKIKINLELGENLLKKYRTNENN